MICGIAARRRAALTGNLAVFTMPAYDLSGVILGQRLARLDADLLTHPHERILDAT